MANNRETERLIIAAYHAMRADAKALKRGRSKGAKAIGAALYRRLEGKVTDPPSEQGMFVIISQDGKPLTDVRGDVITKATRDEFAGWLQPGERIEPYDPVKHPPGEPGGTAGE